MEQVEKIGLIHNTCYKDYHLLTFIWLGTWGKTLARQLKGIIFNLRSFSLYGTIGFLIVPGTTMDDSCHY